MQIVLTSTRNDNGAVVDTETFTSVTALADDLARTASDDYRFTILGAIYSGDLIVAHANSRAYTDTYVVIP